MKIYMAGGRGGGILLMRPGFRGEISAADPQTHAVDPSSILKNPVLMVKNQ